MSLPIPLLSQKLHQILLLGLNRLEMDYKVRAALENLGVDPLLSPEEQLLPGIVVVHQLEKSCRGFAKYPDNVSPDIPADERPVASPKIEPFLSECISGQFPALLPEILFLLNRNQLLIPLHWVPKALERAARDSTIVPYLKPVLGNSGAWLISLFPPWQKILNSTNPDSENPRQTSARQQILKALAGESGHVYPRSAEQICATPDNPWPETFSLQVLDLIATRTTVFNPWNDEGTATLLLIAAQSCPKTLFYRYSSYSWPEEGYFSTQWQPLIRKFTAMLHFRKAMHAALYDE